MRPQRYYMQTQIGDWIMDTYTGNVYEVTDRKVDIFSNWYILQLKIEKNSSQLWNKYHTTVNDDSIRTYFKQLPNAKVLYGSK